MILLTMVLVVLLIYAKNQAREGAR
jgi:hypothetical protein